jgi:uncharacterized protein
MFTAIEPIPMNAIPRIFACLLLSAAIISLPASTREAAREAATKAPARLPTLGLSVNGHTLRAELAIDDATRQQGLMFRRQMGKNDGMLFVFPQVAYHAMWMRNTLIPLSVAYMDDSGRIVSIHEMQAETETTHQAAGPVRYALEMNAHWFSNHKIKPGDIVKGLERAPRAK